MELHGHPMSAKVKVANLEGELGLKLELSASITDTHEVIETLTERLPKIAESISEALDRRAARMAQEDEGGYDDNYQPPPPSPPVEHVFAGTVLSTDKHRLRLWPCPAADRQADASPVLDLIGVEFGTGPKSALIKIEADYVVYRIELLFPMRSVHATGSDFAAIHGETVYVDLSQLQTEATGPGFERKPSKGAKTRTKQQGRLGLATGPRELPPPSEEPPMLDGGGEVKALPAPDDDDVIDAEYTETLPTEPPETAGDALGLLMAQGEDLAAALEPLTGPELMAWIRVVEGNPDAPRTSKERALKRLCKAADEARSVAA